MSRVPRTLLVPEALQRKYPNAPKEWAWQYAFPAAALCPHPRTGKIARHHLHETSLQRQIKAAARTAGVRAAAFFADSDAILALNHSQHDARIREIVSDFSDRHGEDSAWILPHPDSEGLSVDTLFLVCHQLPGQISDELQLCRAGPITRLTPSQMRRLFPTRASSFRAYVVTWD